MHKGKLTILKKKIKMPASSIKKKKYFGLMSTLFWALAQVIIASPLLVIFYFALLIFAGLMPGLSLYLLGEVTQTLRLTGAEIPLMAAALWCLVLFIEGIVDSITSMMRVPLNEKMVLRCNVLLMERANSFLSIAPFEHAQAHDVIHALREGVRSYPLSFVYTLAYGLRRLIAVLSIVTALSIVHTWLPFFVIIASLPQAVATIFREKQGWDLALFRSPQARRMSWLAGLTLDERASKEIRVFNFGSFLVNRYKHASEEFLLNSRSERWKIGLIGIVLSLFTVVANIGILFWIFHSISKTLALESAVISLQALIMSQQNLPACMETLGLFSAPLLFFQKLRKFINRPTQDLIAKENIEPPNVIQEIVFEQVSFHYTDGRKALDNISFVIRKGEKLALVGENGAGKSTIIKLLSRLYDPSQGRILINGTDLREIKIDLWRQKLSLVFQDYVNYSLTATENIGLGNLEKMQHKEHIENASARSGFSEIAERLPKGLETMLGKEFGGTTLSGGEWQKLALARAFFRDSEILVLDEPSASLDPKSEYDTFQQIGSLIRNKTTIFVTHRLGSIKIADRVVVLKKGQIVENGSHEELLKKNGEYARLYRLQASSYDFEKSTPS